MNAFLSALKKHDIKYEVLKKKEVSTLQANLGNLCNQSCRHCHVEASPGGENIMQRPVAVCVLKFLYRNKIKTLDITGGAPELNPNFDFLVTSARPLVEELIVRSNLTVFFKPGKEYLPGFFKDNKVHLICSMPCYTKENVDRQRGEGAFEKSIKALQLLNDLGFSNKKELQLDLVYNPQGAYLPALQSELERDYKKALHKEYGIEFGRLLTITNVAINRFRKYLEINDEYVKYTGILEQSFNPETVSDLMCRSFLSVGFDGLLYDCDFNLALGLALKGKNGDFLSIGTLNATDLKNRDIITGEHCLSCTAASGSSCQGALS